MNPLLHLLTKFEDGMLYTLCGLFGQAVGAKHQLTLVLARVTCADCRALSHQQALGDRPERLAA